MAEIKKEDIIKPSFEPAGNTGGKKPKQNLDDVEIQPGQVKRFRVKVQRLGGDEENRKNPIQVNTGRVETGGKRVFYPGETVELTSTQIELLKNSKQQTDVEIPDHGGESGIYNAKNPVEAAKLEWPGYTIRLDPETGALHATLDEDVYSVVPENTEF